MTARRSLRILIVAPIVLNNKKAKAVMNTEVESELDFGLPEPGFRDAAVWFDMGGMVIGAAITEI